MPYWPPRHAEIAIYDSALKRVASQDIRDVLSLHLLRLEVIEVAKSHRKWDLFYGSRSVRAVARTSDGRLLEVVLRRDGRAARERCIVFHARYL